MTPEQVEDPIAEQLRADLHNRLAGLPHDELLDLAARLTVFWLAAQEAFRAGAACPPELAAAVEAEVEGIVGQAELDVAAESLEADRRAEALRQMLYSAFRLESES